MISVTSGYYLHKLTISLQHLLDYIHLLKPAILLLIIVTTVPSMVLEGSLLHSPCKLFLVLAGIFLCGGAANIFNQVWDRDIDAIMDRTRYKRSIPTGKVCSIKAFYLSLVCCFVALFLLAIAGNTVAAMLGMAAMTCYVLYTTLLKRRSRLNMVVGGIAGALAPCIGWAAGTATLDLTPLLMSLIVFLWSPPHFWSLAIFRKDEYAKADIPVHPLIAGEYNTRLQIMLYCALLVAAVAILGVYEDLGWPYLVGTTGAGVVLIWKTGCLLYLKSRICAQKLFRFSIVYLAIVFSLMLT